MIAQPGLNRQRPIHLLDQQQAGHLVGKRHPGEGKGLVRPMTMDRAPVNRLTREFFGLQKLSVDSLLREQVKPPAAANDNQLSPR